MHQVQSLKLKCLIVLVGVLVVVSYDTARAGYGSPSDMAASIQYQRQKGQRQRGENTSGQYTDQELQDAYYRNPNEAMSGMMDGRYPVRGVIQVNSSRTSSRNSNSSSRRRRRSSNSSSLTTSVARTTPARTIPSVPRIDLKRQETTPEETTEVRAVSYVPSAVTGDMIRKSYLSRIKKLRDIKTVPHAVISNCESLIKYYPDSAEAAEARLIMQETRGTLGKADALLVATRRQLIK